MYDIYCERRALADNIVWDSVTNLLIISSASLSHILTLDPGTLARDRDFKEDFGSPDADDSTTPDREPTTVGGPGQAKGRPSHREDLGQQHDLGTHQPPGGEY